jgi:hypothetical protein
MSDDVPSESVSQAASKNAAAIVEFCRRELESSGFVNRKGNTLWRRTNQKFDILKFDIIPRGRCQKWRVPLGSFGLEPSCLLPFLPRLGHLPTDGLQPDKGFGQVRLALRRGVAQSMVKVPNIWWAGDSADIFDMAVKDIHRVIKEKVIPFFSRFEDVEEVLRTFLEDDDNIGCEGVWEFGKKESPSRLLYVGFTAIECDKWDLAVSSLRACHEKTMKIPLPVRESVQAEMLPYVDQGIACAEQRRRWSSGFD